jgi:hypothetical protein
MPATFGGADVTFVTELDTFFAVVAVDDFAVVAVAAVPAAVLLVVSAPVVDVDCSVVDVDDVVSVVSDVPVAFVFLLPPPQATATKPPANTTAVSDRMYLSTPFPLVIRFGRPRGAR